MEKAEIGNASMARPLIRHTEGRAILQGVDRWTGESLSYSDTVAGMLWHAEIVTTSAAHGTERHWDVTWRTPHLECCGEALRWLPEWLPVWGGRSSYGELQERVVQCGRCGQTTGIKYRAKELTR